MACAAQGGVFRRAAGAHVGDFPHIDARDGHFNQLQHRRDGVRRFYAGDRHLAVERDGQQGGTELLHDVHGRDQSRGAGGSEPRERAAELGGHGGLNPAPLTAPASESVSRSGSVRQEGPYAACAPLSSARRHRQIDSNTGNPIHGPFAQGRSWCLPKGVAEGSGVRRPSARAAGAAWRAAGRIAANGKGADARSASCAAQRRAKAIDARRPAAFARRADWRSGGSMARSARPTCRSSMCGWAGPSTHRYADAPSRRRAVTETSRARRPRRAAGPARRERTRDRLRNAFQAPAGRCMLIRALFRTRLAAGFRAAGRDRVPLRLVRGREPADPCGDQRGVADHRPVRRGDFVTAMRAQPAVEAAGEGGRHVPVVARHDDLHGRLRIALARPAGALDEIRAVELEAVQAVAQLIRIGIGDDALGSAQPQRPQLRAAQSPHELGHERQMEERDVPRFERLPQIERRAKHMVEARPRDRRIRRQPPLDGRIGGRFPALNRPPVVADEVKRPVAARHVGDGKQILREYGQLVVGAPLRCVGRARAAHVVRDHAKAFVQMLAHALPHARRIGIAVHEDHGRGVARPAQVDGETHVARADRQRVADGRHRSFAYACWCSGNECNGTRRGATWSA
ncbi:hypothetical protein BURPS1710b_A2521 [Burkholderia pseudomallei 1710b]|uniref:Uncharacterized protein n=1 Tax=Burkholderia pseudomallei (strain 1710b) TaxID=320372 RepID=Q3JFI2_BURP1|nr:hypothetical protein BURPS1710b_A2521 [Burkholderia pseudomallei 1710b]